MGEYTDVYWNILKPDWLCFGNVLGGCVISTLSVTLQDTDIEDYKIHHEIILILEMGNVSTSYCLIERIKNTFFVVVICWITFLKRFVQKQGFITVFVMGMSFILRI